MTNDSQSEKPQPKFKMWQKVYWLGSSVVVIAGIRWDEVYSCFVYNDICSQTSFPEDILSEVSHD